MAATRPARCRRRLMVATLSVPVVSAGVQAKSQRLAVSFHHTAWPFVQPVRLQHQQHHSRRWRSRLRLQHQQQQWRSHRSRSLQHQQHQHHQRRSRRSCSLQHQQHHPHRWRSRHRLQHLQDQADRWSNRQHRMTEEIATTLAESPDAAALQHRRVEQSATILAESPKAAAMQHHHQWRTRPHRRLQHQHEML